MRKGRRDLARTLPLLHERQRAEGVERDCRDEPLERAEQDALIDDLPHEAQDDARQSKDRPNHRITSPVTRVTRLYPSSLNRPNPSGAWDHGVYRRIGRARPLFSPSLTKSALSRDREKNPPENRWEVAWVHSWAAAGRNGPDRTLT